VDGTLTHSDIFRDLVAFRRFMKGPGHLLWMAGLPLRGAMLLALDRVSRITVNRMTYKWYRGFRREDFVRWADRFQEHRGLGRFHPGAIDVLLRHVRAGDRVVFVTGAVDHLVRPLPRLLAERTGVAACADIRIEAVRLEERDGAFTGELLDPPLGQEEKALRVREVAAEEGLDLAASSAYGDSIADLPMLECVGRPVAVNPDARLRGVAARRGWTVLHLRNGRADEAPLGAEGDPAS
jgi:HAD superfamily hydrolase (TIGR01490 family)